jgi:ABC-type branched-subunit amino acid transport system substrate-binding protein
MVSRALREKVAVGFLAASLVSGALLGIAAIRSAAQPQTQTLSGVQGTVAAPGAPNSAAGPSAAAGPAAPGVGPAQPGGGGTVPGGVANSGASSGVTGGTILVGGIFDMTGPVDSSVERDTVRAYFAKVNAAGGVNGRKLVLQDCDSQYDPASTQRCAVEMANQHVLAIVGWTAPKAEDQVINFLAAPESQGGAGIPVVGGLGTPNEFKWPISFPTSANFFTIGLAQAHRLCQLGYRHPALVTLNDVNWVQAVNKAVRDEMARTCGAKPTDEEDIASTWAGYDGTVFNLMHAGNNGTGCTPGQTYSGNPNSCPDSLIAGLDPFSYKRLFDAMQRAGWQPPLLAFGLDKGNVVNPNDPQNLQTAYGPELKGANSLVAFYSPYDHRSNPTVSDYLSTVQQYFPGQVKNLDIYTQIAWSAAQVFVEGAKRAGPNLTRATLVQGIQSLSNFQTGWSTPLTYTGFDSQGGHDPNRCFVYMKHEDAAAPQGTWRTVSGWNCT